MQNAGIFFSSLKKLKMGYRMMALVSIVGISGSIYIMSYATHFYACILVYGVFFGLFIGYGYLTPIRNCYDYLPNRKGMPYCMQECAVGFACSGLGWAQLSLL